MGAGKLDLYIEQGATFSQKLTLRAPPVAPATIGEPIDLTGCTFEAKLKKNVGDTAVVATFEITVLDQATNTGEILIELPHTVTSAITLKSQKGAVRKTEPFAYDLEQTFPSGKKRRLLEGVANVSPEVTK